MKFILILFSILLTLCIDLILGSPTDYDLYWDIETRFCGPWLAVEMSLVCQGRYNDDERSRRPKNKRGIVDECCTIPCTRRYLKINYCGPEPEMSNTTQDMEKMVYVNYHAYYLDLIQIVLQEPQTDE
ncbi:uncharacterized protein LOC132936505 [Metopolophium dirhodum]|uniref:uncharacterized protein LOC132936505 n=1 Tax=Metopolophium dirhodum TaxID=44670 RepID=UPI00298F51A5|nr:uncharacterized protein LOC132936505 [Metopolophium dirhodum]